MEFGASEKLMTEARQLQLPAQAAKRADYWSRRLELGSLTQSGKILHYGCGLGHSIKGLGNATGYEANPHLAAACVNRKITVFTQEDMLEGSHYDVLLCSDRGTANLLSRLTLDKALGHLKQWLAPQGMLLFTIDKETAKTSGIGKISHSNEALTQFFQQNGLRILEIKPIPHILHGTLATISEAIGIGFYLNLITLLTKFFSKKKWLIKAVPEI